MSIALGIVLLLAIYVLWKLFVDGWLFKIILFFAGWIGLYVICYVYVEGAKNVAITIGTDNPVSFTWAAVVPSIICFLALLTTKVRDE